MAWIRYRVTRRLGRQAYVQWREGGRVRSEPCPEEPRAMQSALRAAEQREEAARGAEAPSDGPALLQRFLAAKRAERRRPGTLAFYARHLGRLFSTWAGVPVHRWNRALMDDYLEKHPGWSPRRQGMVVAVSRTFVRWAEGERLLVPDFVRGLVQHTTPPSTEPALTAEQLRALLHASRGHRLELPVALAIFAGLSLGDLHELTWSEVDLDGGTIRRGRAKTGTRIVVPIAAPLAAVLLAHRAMHGPVVRSWTRGDPDGHTALRRLFASAGMRGRGGWHSLRHGFGTLLDSLGASYGDVGRLLAHRPGSPVTARYIRPEEAGLRRVVDQLGRVLGP